MFAESSLDCLRIFVVFSAADILVNTDGFCLLLNVGVTVETQIENGGHAFVLNGPASQCALACVLVSVLAVFSKALQQPRTESSLLFFV